MPRSPACSEASSAPSLSGRSSSAARGRSSRSFSAAAVSAGSADSSAASERACGCCDARALVWCPHWPRPRRRLRSDTPSAVLGVFSSATTTADPQIFPGAWRFPKGLPPTEIRVHPTQLYEAAGLGVIAWALIRWRRQGTPNIVVLGRYLVLAGTLRFLIEFVRINRRLAGPVDARAAHCAWPRDRWCHDSGRRGIRLRGRNPRAASVLSQGGSSWNATWCVECRSIPRRPRARANTTGRRTYFCSKVCKTRFDADPGKYAK